MTTIITKNSSTASSAPVAGDLTKGELAVNVTDKKLYTKDNGGSVVKLVGSLGNQEASAVAITGGAIDGTPIGGTTASTASFTTVSASSNVTLSGGTANGVLYLNGSKVATSGSALTFDGNKVNTTKYYIAQGTLTAFDAASGGTYLTYGSGVGELSAYSDNSGTTAVLQYTGSYQVWKAGGSEAMRLTSTSLYTASGINVGIGTSSPGYKLDVVGTLRATGNSLFGRTSRLSGGAASVEVTGTGISLINDNGGSNNNWSLIQNTGTSGQSNILFTSGAGTLLLDHSGNLGLGVTPQTQDSTYRAISISSSANYWSLAGHGAAACEGNLLWNAKSSGNETFTYMTSGDLASRFRQSGYFSWHVAPSGTAGNAITFTQAMTLDASGNLLVGTTSVIQSGTISLLKNGTTSNGISIQDTNAGGGVQVNFVNSSGTQCGYISHNSTTTAYNITSDQRLKENIVDADSASALIDSLQVRKFDWKSDGNHQRYGFIAQELVTVAPEAVHQPADPEQMMAVDYSKLVPMLVKEIQSLRARVAQLESN